MNLKDAIYQRQSVRKYQPMDIPDSTLNEILDAGRVAPSGKNCQNWHFVVIKNRVLKDEIGRAILNKNEAIALQMDQKDPEKGLRFRKFAKNFTLFFLNAPVLIVVYTTQELPSGYEELKFIGAPQDALDRLCQRSNGLINVGAALENMNLRAVELGCGACWMTGQTYAAEEIEALIQEHSGFQRDGWFLTCMMALGVPQPNLKSPGRKSLDEICTFVR